MMQRDLIAPADPQIPIRRSRGTRSPTETSIRTGDRLPGHAAMQQADRRDGIAFLDLRTVGPLSQFHPSTLPRDGLVLQVPLGVQAGRPLAGSPNHSAPERICSSAVTLLGIRSRPVFRELVGTVQIWLSSKVMGAVAESMGLAAIDPMEALKSVHGRTLLDPTIHDLVASAVATLDRADRGAAIFRIQLARALAAHLLSVHAEPEYATPTRRGGLAPWQLRRAQERIDAELGDAPCLKAVAAECGLSVSHFARAFRQSVGVSPHAWIVRQRVVRAKVMMRAQDRSLAEIALACGFSDQSHFTRVFAREEDMSPGRWRRIAEPDDRARILEDA